MTLNHTINGILQSLGWAILHSFWQMAFVWLSYFLIFGWHRRFSPVMRHNAALIFLMAGTIWFIATFSNEFMKFVAVGQYLPMMPETSALQGATVASSFSNWNEFLRQFTERNIAWLSATYLLLTTLTAWKLIFSLWMVRLLKTRGILPADMEFNKLTDSLASRLQITKKVYAYISERVDVPATFGYLKPVILVPVAAIAQLTPAQLESVLLHELAHIRRADYLVNILVSVMETILVHNPFAWLLAKSIRTERELCCDDVVLSQNRDILSYASALLALEKNRMIPQPAMAMASNGKKGQLLIRVQRMLEPGRNSAAGAHRLMGIAFMGLLCILMAWAIPGKSIAETKKKTPELMALYQPAANQAPGKVPLVLSREENIVVKKLPTTKTKKIAEIQTETEILGDMGQITWEEPMVPEAFQIPVPGTEQRFDFSFKVPEPETRAPLQGKALKELRALMFMNDKEKLEQAAMEEKILLLNDAFGKNEAIRQEIILQTREKEWEAMAQQMKILEQEKLFNGKKLSELSGKYPTPYVIYRNQELKSSAPGVARKKGVRTEPKATKIQKIKMRDGYILRIETGAEAIDIRIAEGDQVVEGTIEH